MNRYDMDQFGVPYLSSDGDWLDADTTIKRITELERQNAELVEALEAVREDLIARAENSNGTAVVSCGQSVWFQLNDVLDKHHTETTEDN